MKLGRIWDYVMRRKGWFAVLLVALISGSIVTGKLLSADGGFFLASSSSEVVEAPVYNNSLILKITGATASTPSYQLTFTNNFTRASVRLSDSPLENEAYVRIFDPSGQLVRGEYTRIQERVVTQEPEQAQPNEDTLSTDDADEATTQLPTVTAVEYVFANAPITYEVELAVGSIIEVHAADAKFYSTLNNREAEAFRPANTERYIVMPDGLRKENWSELEGELQIYALLKRQIVQEIESYQAQLSDAVLNNRHLDIANKTRITLAYRQLRPADQATYAEFIEHLARGGVPVLSYTGKTEFMLGDAMPNWQEYFKAVDGEDGEIDQKVIAITGDVDFTRAGEYVLAAKALDSDLNEGILEVKIVVAGPISPQPIPPIDDTGINDDEEINQPVAPPSNDPQLSASSQIASTAGGGRNAEDAAPVVATDETETNEQPDAPQVEAPETKVTNITTPTNAENQVSNNEAEKSGWKWQNLLWIGLGIIVVLGLVRFICDHYVR